ncbi:MAG: hypothetical protein KTR31_08575 [Myxococcales bacterium]|nr:hypothetical protein [Myxococcales bacterium]
MSGLRLLVSMGLKAGGDRSAPLRPQLVEIDADAQRVLRRASFPADPQRVAGPASHQELTAASLDRQGLLLQPSHVEVLTLDPHSLRVVRRQSDPAFHAVHSATPRPAGGLVVSCASTDRVLELDEAGAVVAEHRLAEGRVPEGVDLRRLDHDALKPHEVHPNHALYVGGELWVTRFEDRCCRAIPSGRTIELPEAMPHDGRLRAGWLWFTQVTGRVVAVDPHTLQRQLELDLAEITGERRMLGWCRGIEVVGSRLFVGFTMLRRTRHREVARLLVRGVRGRKLPTRVMEVDLDTRRVAGITEVGNAAGGTIYSVTAVPGSDSSSTL